VLLVSDKGFCDQIALRNGCVIQGNVKSQTEDVIEFDVVIEDKLVGALIWINKDEIKETVIDGKYSNLQREDVGLEESQQYQAYLRKESSSVMDIDERIRQRVEKEKQRNDEIDRKQEENRRFNRILEHEAEMENLEHQNKKDLITHSQKNKVQPSVVIIDK
jgi:hypothetical protein